MASFAQRMNLRPTRSLIQTDALDDETRTELWNVTLGIYRVLATAQPQAAENVTSALWAWTFKKPRDEEPSNGLVWSRVKERILKGVWFDALDIIEEFVGYVQRFSDWRTDQAIGDIVQHYNDVFVTYLVGYRFIEQKIVPLDNSIDADAVTDALTASGDFTGARGHLQRASELLADRKSPDYPNSIKESISAVESVVRKVTGDGTLSDGLKKLQAAGIRIHPALLTAWQKMYGWTSDAGGIRHAAVEQTDVDQAIAKYMLITCSAFVTYLIETGRAAKLI